MPLYQVSRRELVYVLRTYEIEASDANQARALVYRGDGECVDELMEDTYSIADSVRQYSVQEA